MPPTNQQQFLLKKNGAKHNASRSLQRTGLDESQMTDHGRTFIAAAGRADFAS